MNNSSNIDFIEYLQNSAYIDLKKTIMNDYNLDLQGWKSDNFDLIFTNILNNSTSNSFQEPLIICEIGTWKGLTATTMANIIKPIQNNFKIICIDTWQGSPDYLIDIVNNNNINDLIYSHKRIVNHPYIYYTFINNICYLKLYNNVIPLPMSSLEASNVLEYYNVNFHIIFIDCYYDYNSIKNNLTYYWKLLKNNGYMFGDYYNIDYVKNVIDEFSNINNINLTINENFWILKK